MSDILTIERGQRWHDDEGGEVKVMAVADGYVLFRRPYCYPSVRSTVQFRQDFKPVPERTET